VTLGDSQVGKSAIVERFVRDNFHTGQPNVGAVFLTKTVPTKDATVIFQIWDTAGQERYRALAPMYYRGSAAAILVYDVTNPASFESAKQWEKSLLEDNPTCEIIYCGNKMDLGNQETFLVENQPHFQVSAKTGEGISEMFSALTNLLSRGIGG